jgi:hypothetical protein
MIFFWICLFWLTSSKNDVYFFQSRSLAEPLATSRGTLGFRGTSVEKPCANPFHDTYDVICFVLTTLFFISSPSKDSFLGIPIYKTLTALHTEIFYNSIYL